MFGDDDVRPRDRSAWAHRTVIGCVALVMAFVLAATASAQVEPYGTDNYGSFWNILPPGTNGTDNLAQLALFKATGARPAHNDDQLGMYNALTTAAPNIQTSQIGDYFKDATFGVPASDVGSTESPEPGVTIEFDKQFAVPHIYGDTRAELEFGIGWATAQTRLFEIDVLRHAGDGTLASFAGGSNAAMDESVWEDAPYTQQDLQAQVAYIGTLPGGQQLISDGQNYIDGINAYIKMIEGNPINLALYLPGEYAAIGQPLGPKPFTVENIISIASLIGGQLGQGGGGQLQAAILYQQFKQRFGREHNSVAGSPEQVPASTTRPSARHPDRSGFGSFLSFVDPNDPEAPTTVHKKAFPYQTLPSARQLNSGSIALPDPGSVQYVNPVLSGSVPSGGAVGLTRSAHNPLAPTAGTSTATGFAVNGGKGLVGNFPTSDSNALLVSGKDTTTGHPIAVFGPQVAYDSPQILMEEDIHGPGISADGAAFPGTNIYVELGHGDDYAWSATSEGQNIIDTFAVPLCNPAGGTVSTDSDYYSLKGQCVQMQTLTDSESWKPNLADSTRAGSATFQTLRTAYGLVIARATIHGRPVVYTNLRSTYFHELDSALGFEQYNDPAEMQTPQQFDQAAYKIGYTFNWFYVNSKHIAYFGSGLNPVRAKGTDPIFPTLATDDWQGTTPSAAPAPTTTSERATPPSAHPQVVDQPFITSWNNKPAHGYDYVDGEYSSIYRSQLLDQNIEHYLAGGQKMTLVDLINAMGNAGTQDLRGVTVLPYALKILGHPSNPVLAQAVSELQAWVASGAHRINRGDPGASGQYDQSAAVQVMDAWWPLLVKAVFQPVLGPSLMGDVEGQFSIDNLPHNHQGSAWDTGFYGIVQKDLRSALGDRVAGPLNRVYCGDGSLASCRAALDTSLLQAAGETAAQVYPASSGCAAGDQMCYDAIHYTTIGAVTQPPQEWVNRPTFQQAVQIESQAPASALSP
jgi:acyl-homoserine lactone acylase PvdQ